MKELESIKKKLVNILNENSSGKTPEEELFHALAEKFLFQISVFEKVNADYFKTASFEDLRKDNIQISYDILPENYSSSFANPSYSVKIFGETDGPLYSYFYSNSRIPIKYIFLQDEKFLVSFYEYFLDAYEKIKSGISGSDQLRNIVTAYERRIDKDEQIRNLKVIYGSGDPQINKIFSDGNFDDLRYLFRYGKYISRTEISIAQYLVTYPADKAASLASATVKAYIKGFSSSNKELKKGSSVNLYYSIGTEKIIHEAIKELKAKDLKPIVSLTYSTPSNKQYSFDHKFDIGLMINEQFTKNKIAELREAYSGAKDELAINSGMIHFELFGEKPYQQENKPESIKLTEDQNILYRNYMTSVMKLSNEFKNRSETSFTAIQMPSPEIGKDFENIFAEMAEINMLDSDKYEVIQKKMIDKLDSSTLVHIKGKDRNETDFYVKLNQLSEPDKETNFANVGADLNIPVGEVFTTPVLTGTHGLLHFREIFLKGIRFSDLKFTFKDGFISEYSCSNTNDNGKNKELVRENLLFPNSTLPLGEFAIGTNTLAYVFAKKYNIVHLLPILIIEKMGPHFAIGDTCFTMQEDNKFYNPIDKKEVIARENELSILRKEDFSKAYTNVHIDMTLPFEEIEFISAIDQNGSSELIIENGLFKVSGTEELNTPLLNENILKIKSA